MSIADEVRSGVIAADGTATLTFTPSARQTWVVSQVSVSAPTSGGTAVCGVYRDNIQVCPVVAQGDAAGGDPPVVVRPGQRLQVKWTTAVVGARVQAMILYDDGN